MHYIKLAIQWIEYEWFEEQSILKNFFLFLWEIAVVLLSVESSLWGDFTYSLHQGSDVAS